MREREWAAAQRWITEALAGRGTPATGPVVVERVRPWSTVARVPVGDGVLWFKGASPGTAYEAGLVEALGRITPRQVPVPVAAVPERGWLLLPDGGPTLRAVGGDRFDPHRWERVLREYAELQRAVAGHVDELLAAGVPDVRPERLPALLAGLLDDHRVTDPLTPAQLAGLRDWQPRVERLCLRLAASGIGASIQHDDLHTDNVFVDGAGGLRFFDFGDASVAHPFGSMLVALRVAAYEAGLPHGDPLLYRLRDTYLVAWADGRDLAELAAICADAVVVAKIGKALAYQRGLTDADEAQLREHGGAVHGWLTELLGPDVI